MLSQNSEQKHQAFLNSLFDMFDKNKTGTLNLNQMTVMLNQIFEGDSEKISPLHIQILMAEADMNKDGVCSKQEFFDLYKRYDRINLNSLRFKEAFAVPAEKVEASKEKEPEKKTEKFQPPTLNMDQENFKKLKKQLDYLEKKDEKDITDEDIGVIVDKIIQYFDKDKSGALEAAEMINFMRAIDAEEGELRGASEFQLNMMFSMMDPNNDGKLQREELIQFLKQATKMSKKRQQIKKEVYPGSWSSSLSPQEKKQMMQVLKKQTVVLENPLKVTPEQGYVQSWHHYPDEVQKVKFASETNKDQLISSTSKLSLNKETLNKYQEEIALLKSKQMNQEEYLPHMADIIFKYFDMNKTGVLEMNEMMGVLRSMMTQEEDDPILKLSFRQMKKLVYELDPNHDGKFSRAQLIQFLKKCKDSEQEEANEDEDENQDQPSSSIPSLGQVKIVDLHLPIPEGWRRMTDEEGKKYQKGLERLLSHYSIVAAGDRALVGSGYGYKHKQSYGNECGQWFIVKDTNAKQEEKQQPKVEIKPDQKQPKDSAPYIDEEILKRFESDLMFLKNNKMSAKKKCAYFADTMLKHYDLNKSGALEMKEMIAVIRAMDSSKEKALMKVSDKQMEPMFDQIDPNHDGKMERDQLIEFLSYSLDLEDDQEEEEANEDEDENQDQPSSSIPNLGQVKIVDLHLPIPEGWRRMTDEEGRKYQKGLERLLSHYSIVAVGDRALVGSGYGYKHKQSYGNECGQWFIVKYTNAKQEEKQQSKVEKKTLVLSADQVRVAKISDPVPKGWRKLAADECFIIQDPSLQD